MFVLIHLTANSRMGCEQFANLSKCVHTMFKDIRKSQWTCACADTGDLLVKASVVSDRWENEQYDVGQGIPHDPPSRFCTEIHGAGNPAYCHTWKDGCIVKKTVIILQSKNKNKYLLSVPASVVAIVSSAADTVDKILFYHLWHIYLNKLVFYWSNVQAGL